MTLLVAARAPGIRDALQHAKRSGAALVILDGALVHIDRNQIDRPFCSGKRKQHCMNLQAIADARGNLLLISGAIRGSIHDTKAARNLADPHAAGRVRPIRLGRQRLRRTRSRPGDHAVQREGQA